MNSKEVRAEIETIKKEADLIIAEYQLCLGDCFNPETALDRLRLINSAAWRLKEAMWNHPPEHQYHNNGDGICSKCGVYQED